MRQRAWWLPLLLGAAGIAAYLLSPVAAKDWVYAAVGAASAVAMARGAARQSGRARLAWGLLAAGNAVAVVGDVLWVVVETFTGADPYPSVADVAYLLEYPLVAAGLMTVVRARRSSLAREALVDSSIVTVGLGLLVYVTLVRPLIGSSDPLLTRLVGLGYPVGDIVLLASLARLLTCGGSRTPAFRLLSGGMLLVLLGDTVFTAASDASSSSVVGMLSSVPFLAAYAVWAAAALHPSAPALLEDPEETVVFSRRRLAALTVASLLSPATLAAELALGLRLDGWAVASSSALLFCLVVHRMSGLLGRLQDQTRRLEDQTARLEEQAVRLDLLARTDELTGLPNRRSGDAELERAQAAGAPLSVALLDLDRFKGYNDEHGHQAGDRLLVGASAAWLACLGPGQVLARYGGEEFLLVLPGAGAEDTAELLELLRRATPDGQSFSAGVAAWDGVEAASRLVHRADLALYEAKHGGRARTTVAA
ncbi:diguanylate cyclase (GGDEF)-like protein [Motilibacter peucedani]|uniref:Diguanylate cyclase (GGDEF)-like protein n=1 Tax=Motilibacter peucedani TaxID=598650 RepID=A0A420XPF7_9ACTN|nr:GGDEF domain-containing protein [Motilibacter peucedani]RKS74078.1 diguanylate cyclase (GGDEF)-like protein [Motilibacter peucedani]